MNQQCLECHREIGWQVERSLGLHGREQKRDCAACHPDHAGRDFELIVWEEESPEAFDHSRTGWLLEGRHAALRCADCHKAALQKAPVMKLSKRNDPGQSWLGLQRDCLSCHEDHHQGTLDVGCLDCHRQTKWKPAARFDHAASNFPLTGKHAEVQCAKCHPGRLYKPLEFGECSACHTDPHQDLLGPGCGSCHVTGGFELVDAKAFDHAQTRYPLRGRHAALACASCHDPQKAWGKKPPFSTCGTCHEDAHAGKATRAGRQVDCASCHNERAFKPSVYGVADHAQSDYPLEGKHAAVSCERCHEKQPSGVQLRPAHANCRDCHSDAHAGQLTERADGGACESCHRVEGFKPSTFTVEQHATLRFPLDGKHGQADCADCHGPVRRDLPALPDRDLLGPAGVALTLLDSACASCHLDPHTGRFAAGGERAMPQGCRTCHEADRFHPSTIDPEVHASFNYPLEGAHRAVPCLLCHEELKEPLSSIRLMSIEGSLRPLPFDVASRQCTDCHETPHGEQFASRPNGGACESCHTVETFRPAFRFDHNRDAEFPLTGGHTGVPCADCHPARPGPDGAQIATYHNTSHLCRDCHGRSIPEGSAGAIP